MFLKRTRSLESLKLKFSKELERFFSEEVTII